MVNWPINLSPLLCIASHDVYNILQNLAQRHAKPATRLGRRHRRTKTLGTDTSKALLYVGTKVHFRCGFSHDMPNPHTARRLCPADLAAHQRDGRKADYTVMD